MRSRNSYGNRMQFSQPRQYQGGFEAVADPGSHPCQGVRGVKKIIKYNDIYIFTLYIIFLL
jgi:hypothetical protein